MLDAFWSISVLYNDLKLITHDKQRGVTPHSSTGQKSVEKNIEKIFFDISADHR